MIDYDKLKFDELRDAFSDFSFSQEAQKTIRSELWQKKYGLWTLLSGSCEEAAKKCYENINHFSDELIDIDTCNIHSLKSIAKSVDLGFLCKGLNEEYPLEILELLNLLSVPKHLLLDSNRLLSNDSNDKLNGKIAERIINDTNDVVPLSYQTICEIQQNINHIEVILNTNLIFTQKSLIDLISVERWEKIFKLLSLESTYIDRLIVLIKKFRSENNKKETLRKINNLLNELENYDEEKIVRPLMNMSCDDLIQKIKNLHKLEKYAEFGGLLMEVDESDELQVNWFILLINVIKSNFHNEEYDFNLVPRYFNKETNIDVDLTPLFINMMNSTVADNDAYIYKFILYHFYSLLASKIRNTSLRKLFSCHYNDNDKRYFVSMNSVVKNEYIFEEKEFMNEIHRFLDSDEAEKFLTQTYPTLCFSDKTGTVKINMNFTKSLIDYVEYMKFVSSFRYKDSDELEFDLLEMNFFNGWPIYSQNLEKYNMFGSSGILMSVAKELTDTALYIMDIRSQIKTAIQQFSIIGTKRIATDILADFFIKNYSNRRDWGYISNLYYKDSSNFKFNENVEDKVFKTLSSLFNENEPFSIDIIEYYDDTKYLNIESNMPNVVVGQNLKSNDETVSWWIDSNDLLVSGLLSSPTYEDVYAPCSYFVSDYNEKFWTNRMMTLGVEDTTEKDRLLSNSKYQDFFGQYISTFKDIEDQSLKYEYVSGTLYPFLMKIWDAFALSAIEENGENLGEYEELYKSYIGTDIGINKYKNIENRTFPTIAPIVDIENLHEKNELDDDILYVAKNYYSNIISSLSDAILKILKMHDENGVPFEGWRQQFVNFHGYSTYYEYSENKEYSISDSSKEFDSTDAYIYSKLQKYYYLINKNERVDISEFLTDSFLNNEFRSLLESYLNSDECIYRNFSGYSIKNIEYDNFKNVFALLKKDDETTGKIIFRENCMSLGVPLIDKDYSFILNKDGWIDDAIREIGELANNCVSFGIVNDVMWIFGKTTKDDLYDVYKLLSFKFTYDDNCIIIDVSSIKSYSYNNTADKVIYYLNDFVGCIVDDNITKIKFIFFDREKISKELRDSRESDNRDNELLMHAMLNFIQYELDIDTNKCNCKKINVDDCVVPMFLNQAESSVYSPFEDDTIWKVESYDNRCYIGYEALNKNLMQTGIYEHYKQMNTNSLTICSAQFKFYDRNFYTNSSISQTEYDYFFTSQLAFTVSPSSYVILYENNGDSNAGKEKLIAKLIELLNEYPKCRYEKDGLVVEFLPFTFFKECRDDVKYLISKKISENAIANSGHMIDFDNAFSSVYEPISNMIFDGEPEFYKSLNVLSSVIDLTENVILSSENWILNENIESDNNIKEYRKSNLTFENMNDMFVSLPFLTKCAYEPLTIVAYFKNNTGITFIGDYALDLDLTCYIDDIVERNHKVGYWNGYNTTQYIKWGGDITKGGHENISINVNEYIKNHLQNTSINTHMKIVLGLCWHDSSELKTSDIYISLAWHHVVENIPISFIPDARKDCQNKSLMIDIDMKTGILKYETYHLYPVIKIYYKEKLVGPDEGIPDIKFGFMNLTESELKSWGENNPGWTAVNYHNNEIEESSNDSWLKYYIYSHKNLDLNDGYACASFLIADHIDDHSSFNYLYDVIIEILGRYVYSKSTYLNLRTKTRLSKSSYEVIRCEEIYFGWNIQNVDKETGVNMIYYGYINPDYFKDKAIKEWIEHPIDAALPDYDMQYRSAYENYLPDGNLNSMKMLLKDQFNDLRIEDDKNIDDYVNEVGIRSVSISDFREWAMNKPDISGRLKE